MSTLKRLRESYTSEGIGGTLERVRRKFLPHPPPSLSELLDQRFSFCQDTVQLLASLADSADMQPPQTSEVLGWENEWLGDVAPALHQVGDTEIPEAWNVGILTSKALYSLTRWRKPGVVLETGIARGASSLAVLSALERNGIGELHSIDVFEGVGSLVPSGLQSRWHQHLLLNMELSELKLGFLQILDDLPNVDLFFHDSNHQEWWMRFELETVRPRLSRNGVLASDDVEQNRAFLQALPQGHKAAFLLDSPKASGFTIV